MTSFWRQSLFLWRASGRFTKAGYLKHQASWGEESICFGDPAELQQKTILITGANAGLGRAAAEKLASLGCRLILVCRDAVRGEQAVAEVQTSTGNSAILLEIADISVLSSVRALADRLISRQETIHVLINNAGVLLNHKETTPEEADKTLMTNYLGPYLLTEMLSPLLARSAALSHSLARVIHVSSGGMYTQSLAAFLQDPDFEALHPWDGAVAYSRTKRAQVCLAEIQAAEHPLRDQISFFSCHPGWADSPGVQNSLPSFRETFKDSLRSLEEGADTLIWLAVSPQVTHEQSGLFFEDRVAVTKHLWLSGTESSCTLEHHTSLLEFSTTRTKL